MYLGSMTRSAVEHAIYHAMAAKAMRQDFCGRMMPLVGSHNWSRYHLPSIANDQNQQLMMPRTDSSACGVDFHAARQNKPCPGVDVDYYRRSRKRCTGEDVPSQNQEALIEACFTSRGSPGVCQAAHHREDLQFCKS